MKDSRPVPRLSRLPWLASALLAAPSAHASFLSGDALDAFAMGMAWFVVFVVPAAVVGLFLVIHVLPEKIAERRHHPQQSAIKTLCLLSLLFGGLLWPLAWLWAYTRPVSYRAAYGTDKHESYFIEMATRAERGELDALALDHLREELDEMAQRGSLPAALRGLPARLSQAQPRSDAPRSEGSA